MNEKPEFSFKVTRQTGFKLTLRRAVLLHAIRYGVLPWSDETAGRFPGAVECGNVWILCCGHVYSPKEIASMVSVGWIKIDGPLDHLGRRQTSAGPKITEAWERPYYG